LRRCPSTLTFLERCLRHAAASDRIARAVQAFVVWHDSFLKSERLANLISAPQPARSRAGHIFRAFKNSEFLRSQIESVKAGSEELRQLRRWRVRIFFSDPRVLDGRPEFVIPDPANFQDLCPARDSFRRTPDEPGAFLLRRHGIEIPQAFFIRDAPWFAGHSRTFDSIVPL